MSANGDSTESIGRETPAAAEPISAPAAPGPSDLLAEHPEAIAGAIIFVTSHCFQITARRSSGVC